MNARPRSGLALAARYAVPFGLLLIPVWMTRVNSVVPQPYLDEAFHIPQAQAYWAHRWTHWDPKITTPPGLYLFSYVVCALILLLRGSPTELDPPALRATNAAAAAVLLPLRLQTALDTLRKQRNTRPSGAWLSHTVLNMCLFPPLFFFAGLYYTDILALLVVVEAYNWDLNRQSQPRLAVLETAVFVGLGVAALAFRQTNVFWVSVFFGGLHVVRKLRRATKTCESAEITDIVRASSKNELYDPMVLDASISDYVKTAISLSFVAFNNLKSVITSLVPYVFILAAFGTFVLWNGSVVLGHKEFHTASVHMAQMLYIWPYFLFFSWPLLLAPMANILLPKFMVPKFLQQGFPASRRQTPTLLTALIVLPVMIAVVHFNTIVHPFTLADNRHYVFYVFRILLRSHPLTRYAATVVYFIGAWMVISTMGFSPVTAPPRGPLVAGDQPPAKPSPSQKPAQKGQQKKMERRQRVSKTAAPTASSDPISPEAWAELQEHIFRRQRLQYDTSRVSFVIVWLTATSLSLITAPLVEPRYLIIPWVMWRLHLPPSPTPVVYRQRVDDKKDLEARIAMNFPLFLETVWFLFVNVLTGALFLHGGFEWPQEPGKIQRFLCPIYGGSMSFNHPFSSCHRPTKRPKLSLNHSLESFQRPPTPAIASLHRSITPPPSRLRRTTDAISPHPREEKGETRPCARTISSPIQLTRIKDFGSSSENNVDTVQLSDILGDPMIRECWQFNYLFDVDFLMRQFDEDVRSLVRVKVVHGSWKRESDNRVRIDEACSRYPNVEPIVAYMPEPFGTHHSKMMVLLRHDDFAQVIIHTANMIAGDWANMCQAVWRSPLIPLCTDGREESKSTAWGSGSRFKRDMLAYLKEYGVKKTGPLVEQLAKYDFSAVKAALIASVPSKQKIEGSSNGDGKTLWGWPALKDALRNVPLRESNATPHTVAQMSSIASLGQTDKWLKEIFFNTLTSNAPALAKQRPRYSIIFPTAEEIRRSLNGYSSGGSIHMKLQSSAQQKQLQYLRPYLHHWAGDVAGQLPPDNKDAGRRRAAPHIKTYIRFTDAQRMDMIDWALVTSANLSTQAWGAAANQGGEVRICSWEIGVLVWPELFVAKEQSQSVIMVPCFKQDDPHPSQDISGDEANSEVRVGFRMPYDLPLTPYSAQDIPWCATMPHSQPDWLGQTWEG
ncbi:tyrosyl-DNA phosphodiesterase-domain-containing protein [Aspergillus lucknowensis]|uniref:Dol-P-Glc:Glc(2)Man(9)GlcNAc(2)-PP-Dol alpha-1,2-glucosyltransferase n=1 Tax=Aspergillus lucknowensis TaxID=176173 RepID=A0ABR4M6W4_9EURO